MRKVKLRAGMFLAPFHPLDENPTLTFERDLELAQFADEIGFEEFWYGEHHTGGYENSPSPELMIAAAAQRTKRIKLGTGVVSLPYHNPLMTANRIAQIDHLSFGRAIFGAGPGLLVSDAHMLNLDVRESRDKLDIGLSVITRLLQGEWVTEKYDGWFDLRDAHCQVLPYQRDIEVCVASTFSPARNSTVISGTSFPLRMSTHPPLSSVTWSSTTRAMTGSPGAGGVPDFSGVAREKADAFRMVSSWPTTSRVSLTSGNCSIMTAGFSTESTWSSSRVEKRLKIMETMRLKPSGIGRRMGSSVKRHEDSGKRMNESWPITRVRCAPGWVRTRLMEG